MPFLAVGLVIAAVALAANGQTAPLKLYQTQFTFTTCTGPNQQMANHWDSVANLVPIGGVPIMAQEQYIVSVPANSGFVVSQFNQAATLFVNNATMPSGTYTVPVTIKDARSTVTVPVTITIRCPTSPSPSMRLQPTNFVGTKCSGPNQSIATSGDAIGSFSVSGGVPLQYSPKYYVYPSDFSNDFQVDSTNQQLTVGYTVLPSGTYTVQMAIQDARGQGSTVNTPVTITINCPGQSSSLASLKLINSNLTSTTCTLGPNQFTNEGDVLGQLQASGGTAPYTYSNGNPNNFNPSLKINQFGSVTAGMAYLSGRVREIVKIQDARNNWAYVVLTVNILCSGNQFAAMG